MATLYKEIDGVTTKLSESISFDVEQLRKGALEGATTEEATAFWRNYESVTRTATAVQFKLGKAMERLSAMQKALSMSTADPGTLDKELHQLRQDLLLLDVSLNGNRSKQQVGEKSSPTIGDRLFAVNRGITLSTYGPTETHKTMLKIAQQEISEIQLELAGKLSKMQELEKALSDAGAPWVEGGELPLMK